MSHRLRLQFSETMRQAEFEAAVGIIETCAHISGQPLGRKLTVVAHPGQLHVLKQFLSVWENDNFLTTTDAT